MPQCNLKRALALGVFLFPARLNAFTFTTNSPTQCDDLTVQWTGGTPPFRLLIVPPDSNIRNISIPSTAFVNNAGSFTTQLPLPQNSRVLFSMSDATGTYAGGTSTLYQVGASVSNNQCNVTTPNTDFFFSLDNDFVACKAYPFTQYPNAVQPVTIFGFIPSGQSFTLYPPLGDSYSWNAVNLTAGTSVAFTMIDSLGRNGGVAGIRVVQLSSDSDTSCLSSSGSSGIISSTGTATFQGGKASASASASASAGASSASASKSKSNVGLIAGAAAGGAAVVLLILLAIFCIRKRKKSQFSNSPKIPKEIDSLYQPAGTAAPDGAAYLYMPTQYQYTVPPPPIPRSNGPPTTLSEKLLVQQQQQQIRQYSDPFPPSAPQAPTSNNGLSIYPSGAYTQRSHAGSSSPADSGPTGQPSTDWTPEHLFSGNTYSQMSSSDGRDSYPPAPQTQTSSTRRLIVHTDIEESGEAHPVELPPQYVEGRAPIPGLVSDGSDPQSISTNTFPDSSKRRKR